MQPHAVGEARQRRHQRRKAGAPQVQEGGIVQLRPRAGAQVVRERLPAGLLVTPLLQRAAWRRTRTWSTLCTKGAPQCMSRSESVLKAALEMGRS